MEYSQKEEVSSSPEEVIGAEKKSCSVCKTMKTPLWRSGPSGPKSLCNACGIRFRKKRGGPTAAAKGKGGKNRNLMPLGQEVEVVEGRKRRLRRPRQWGEVERAALLLMALSCGAVFA